MTSYEVPFDPSVPIDSAAWIHFQYRRKSIQVLNNAHPDPRALATLLPAGLSNIKIDVKEKPESSADYLLLARDYGCVTLDTIFRIYDASKVGHPRIAGNSEMPVGYPMYGAQNEPIADRVQEQTRIRNDLQNFSVKLDRLTASIDPVLNEEEMGDMKKFNFLRNRYFGSHLQLPFSKDIVGIKAYPKSFMMVLDRVIAHYISTMAGRLGTRLDCILRGTDAKDTAVGAPTFQTGGPLTHPARLATLEDMPIPNYNEPPSVYMQKLRQWGLRLNLPHGDMVGAPYLSYRQGAKRKAISMWFATAGGYAATHEGTFLESFQRAVFPGPHWLNVIMSPAYQLLQGFRRTKLGMFHTPENQAEYITKLKKQGGICYESDFSNYDMTISNYLLRYVCEKFKNSEFAWEFALFSEYLKTVGVIYPSYTSHDPFAVTFIQNQVSLLSGWLFTSEFGSIISLAVNLWALSFEFSNIVDDWIAGRFIILCQSDDILFTLPRKIDELKFAERVASLGLTTKLTLGSMFLKMFLPLGVFKNRSKSFRPWSRVLQNTFGNEEDYSDKPQGVVLLGLLARCEGLKDHPCFDALRHDFVAMLESCDIFKPIAQTFDQGVISLPQEFVDQIIAYATKEDKGRAWYSNLVSLAQVSPQAAMQLAALNLLSQGKITEELAAETKFIRSLYTAALYKNPDTNSFKVVNAYRKQERPLEAIN